MEARERHEGTDTKVAMIGRKKDGAAGSGDIKTKLLEEKRERRRDKKRRQKERKVTVGEQDVNTSVGKPQ